MPLLHQLLAFHQLDSKLIWKIRPMGELTGEHTSRPHVSMEFSHTAKQVWKTRVERRENGSEINFHMEELNGIAISHHTPISTPFGSNANNNNNKL